MFILASNIASGASLTCITSSGRTVNVLVTGSVSVQSMDDDANAWRKLGAVSVYYYNDASMNDENLIAHYYGMRDLSSAYSTADKLERQFFDQTRVPGYVEPSLDDAQVEKIIEKYEQQQLRNEKFKQVLLIVVVAILMILILAIIQFRKDSMKEKAFLENRCEPFILSEFMEATDYGEGTAIIKLKELMRTKQIEDDGDTIKTTDFKLKTFKSLI